MVEFCGIVSVVDVMRIGDSRGWGEVSFAPENHIVTLLLNKLLLILP